jgi:cytochrome bd ubiquinol oxidase subunit II
MDFQLIWFILIAVLFIGYFFLEGFDFGVGILMPFLSEDDTDRRVVINTIGPFWDGNEVWLITAGGAMFAAFPHWYATFFSAFYVPLFFILIALIVRAVGFEFRSKGDSDRWRRIADYAIVSGSLVPAFLWGVALTNVVRGMPIGEGMHYTGSLIDLLHPYALFGGVVSVAVFTLHGAHFLTLRTAGDMHERARRTAERLWWPTALIVISFALLGYWHTQLFDGLGLVPGTLPLIALVSYVASYFFLKLRRDGWAFASTGLTIVVATIVAFQGLFPRLMPSSLGEAFDLTIYNASSSPMTLKIMFFVALFFVPIVLAYQGWSYWVFRQRVTREAIGGH